MRFFGAEKAGLVLPTFSYGGQGAAYRPFCYPSARGGRVDGGFAAAKRLTTGPTEKNREKISGGCLGSPPSVLSPSPVTFRRALVAPVYTTQKKYFHPGRCRGEKIFLNPTIPSFQLSEWYFQPQTLRSEAKLAPTRPITPPAYFAFSVKSETSWLLLEGNFAIIFSFFY